MKLVELHILQSFPVSCLNRDDVGAPKSAFFGGAQRARVSSQCWKRAIRSLARDLEGNAFAGQRSRYIIPRLKGLFLEKGQSDNSAEVLARSTAEAIGKLDSARNGTVKTLLYFSPAELAAVVSAMLKQPFENYLTDAGLADSDDKKAMKQKEKALAEMNKLAKKAAKSLGSSVKDNADIAIFGRMMADDHSLMLEGAGMFSHALSTHRVANEDDFFSAVDDLLPEDAEGAGHIGTLEFNSACYYRYVGINWDMLSDPAHLQHFSEEERKEVLGAFLKASILAVPNARHNSMFAHNPPQFVLSLVRQGQPLSLANAFEQPIRSTNGYLAPSRDKLQEHLKQLRDTYDLKITCEPSMPEKSLRELVEEVLQNV